MNKIRIVVILNMLLVFASACDTTTNFGSADNGNIESSDAVTIEVLERAVTIEVLERNEVLGEIVEPTISVSTETPTITSVTVEATIAPNKIWITTNVNCSISTYVETTSLTPKEYLTSIGRNKPKPVSEAEICILFSDNIHEQMREDHTEFHQILFDTLGAYDRYVHFIYNLDGNNDEAIAVLNELGAFGGNISSIDELYERNTCLGGFARFNNHNSKINLYRFCNQPNPLRHIDRYLDRPEIVNRYGLMHGWAHEYFHHYQNSHSFERDLGMDFDSGGGYKHINTPPWFAEGSANLFPTYLLRNVFYDLTVTKDHDITYPTTTGRDIDGQICQAILCNLEGMYKDLKKHMMGLGNYESGDVKCREFSALEESRDTGLCGVAGWTTANAYLAYITSYEILFVDIYEEMWKIGFPASFEKHARMTIDEFYIQFTEFMREGSVDNPPPPGFFPDKPLFELADFWSIDSN